MEVDRPSLYLAMALTLMGVEEGAVFAREIGAYFDNCDVKSLRASMLRRDYDPVTRSLLPRAIAQFYEESGFEASEEPDSLVAMFSFMAQLAREGVNLKIQHRFLRAHLIPTLRYAVEICNGLEPFLEIIVEDADYLSHMLTHS